jgi:hypothetical protein
MEETGLGMASSEENYLAGTEPSFVCIPMYRPMVSLSARRGDNDTFMIFSYKG